MSRWKVMRVCGVNEHIKFDEGMDVTKSRMSGLNPTRPFSRINIECIYVTEDKDDTGYSSTLYARPTQMLKVWVRVASACAIGRSRWTSTNISLRILLSTIVKKSKASRDVRAVSGRTS